MVAATGTHLEILGELLGVQDFAAALALVEDIGRQISPILGLERLLVLTKPSHLFLAGEPRRDGHGDP
jgi:hypothetical protein